MKQIKFNEPYLTHQEQEYIKDVFLRQNFYGAGKYTQLCEQKIKDYTGVDHALLTDSCTSALEISALLLRDFSKKQEVIIPSYTFSSTASAFARAGFDIIFCEINEINMMIDSYDFEKKITENTVAVVPVHYGGLSCNIEKICAIASKNNLYVIEDGAQAFGCTLKKKHLGTFGDFGCFSFHETKNLHCGLGGAIVINNEDYASRARHIWERGTNRQEVLKGLVDKYSWVEVGGSFYPTEIQAAFLYSQLNCIEDNLRVRKSIHDKYNHNLSKLKDKKIINFPDLNYNLKSNYHAFFIIFNSEQETDEVREYLLKNNIHAYIGYIPLHSSPVGKRMGYEEDSLPKTELLSKCILRLPLHNNMSINDASYICELLNTFFDES